MNDSSTGDATGTGRRRLLAAGASAATVGLAGCLGARDGPVPEPTVTSDRIDDGWRLLDESESTVFERAYGPVTVRALEHTLTYEDASVAEALADALDASGSPVVFFTTRLDLRPAIDGLPGGIGRDRVMEAAETAAVGAFRARLRNAGTEDLREVDEGVTTVTGGHTATAWRFEGEFALDGETALPDGSTTAVNGTTAVRARLAVWHDGTDALVAGGAFPSEAITAAVGDALSGSVDGETVVESTADAETADALATDPAAFDEEVSALIVSVT